MEDLGLTPSFWHKRRVLLTGHTGFKGSWLLLLLQHFGAKVTGISLAADRNSLFDQIDGSTRCAHNIGDIRSYSALQEIVERACPEIILHLAAQPLVRRSYADPLETISTNVLGTANLLQAARGLSNLLAIVSVTTDKCYANDRRTSGYCEGDTLGGHDPYSNSKACAELVTQCFRDSFFAEQGVGVATARAGNVIGGGDYSTDRLIPDAVRALSCGVSPELRNPRAVRPWQHVLEPLSGYCLLAQKLACDPKCFAGAWNFGPSESDVASVETVVAQLASHWGISGDFRDQAGDHPHEAEVLTLDSTKSMQELGWVPRLPLRTAVEWTANWYRAQKAGEGSSNLCLAQIGAYLTSGPLSVAA